MKDDDTQSTAAAPPPAKGRVPGNSHWCIDSKGRLGMVGDVTPVTTFHVYDAEANDGAGALISKPEVVDLSTLRICKASELPAHLNYTEQQLVDLGYL